MHNYDRRLPGPIKSVKVFISVTAARGRINSSFITIHKLMILWTHISFVSKTQISALTHSMETEEQKDVYLNIIYEFGPILKCTFIIQLTAM